MTGRELIERIRELEAEDKEVWFQPKPGDAYKEVRKADIEVIGWSHEIIGIRN